MFKTLQDLKDFENEAVRFFFSEAKIFERVERFEIISETWEPPQFWKKTLSEWKGHSRSNSRNSGAFSEQLSEWLSRPNLCENPILEATLGATLGIGWTPKFQPKFSERFFQNWGGPRAPEYLKF